MVLKLDDKMPFGKHKGKKLRDLAQNNYCYVLWCHQNIDAKFSDGVLYIARKEYKASEGRQLSWAYGFSSKRHFNDYRHITDDYKPSKKKITISGQWLDQESDDHSRDFGLCDQDEYAGLSYSDFGNN